MNKISFKEVLTIFGILTELASFIVSFHFLKQGRVDLAIFFMLVTICFKIELKCGEDDKNDKGKKS